MAIRKFQEIQQLALESPNVNMFEKELAIIKNETKKAKLRNVLRRACYKNIAGAASSTGKYHPKFAQGDWGLSRHTKAVVKFVDTICDAFPELDQDTLVAAAIAHDAFKYASDNDKYTSRDHAGDAARELEKEGLKDEARLVRSHMGRFDHERNNAIPAPNEFDEKMLHLADYLASKKFLSIRFDSQNNLLSESLFKAIFEKSN
jgi:23S rRNA maturation-related 3'-5' exoribonuclease YhaM